MNPRAHICFYGLYAPVNEEYLRGLGVGTILGGEFEEGLASLAARLKQGAANGNGSTKQQEPVISLARQKFLVPDRAGMLEPAKYASVVMPGGEQRVAGSTEATRGCKHLCRHCPIVPVYNGAFRVVEREVVLEDIRQQVAAGARHITFGDPDFFNGPAHALSIVEAVHREFPELSLRRDHQDRAPAKARRAVCRRCATPDACSSPAPWNRWMTRARKIRQGPHARRFSRGRGEIPGIGHDAPAHVRAVHAVDDARGLHRFAGCDRGAGLVLKMSLPFSWPFAC